MPIKKPREDFGREAVLLAVNIIPGALLADRSSSKWSSLISRTVYRQTLVAHERPCADFYLNPTLGYTINYNKRDAAKRIEIGYAETLLLIPKLKQILAPV